MAPIKRLLSTKNTSPSEKGIPFLQGQNSVRHSSCFYLRPIFLKSCCAALMHLLTGTHQDQGQREKTLRLLSEEAIKPRGETTVLLCSPWSEIWTPEKDRYLAKANRLLQDLGLLSGQPLGAFDKGRSKIGHSPVPINVRECSGVPTKLQGFSPP
jgi:hypothetical protein